jgi:hypothetical protein
VQITEYPSPELPADRFSPELCDLVARCLEKDPQQRPTAEQLLRHAFIQRYTDAGDAELAAFLQALAAPHELLQSYAQLFAANYYCLLDAKAEVRSMVSRGAERRGCCGESSSRPQLLTRLPPAASGLGYAQGLLSLHALYKEASLLTVAGTHHRGAAHISAALAEHSEQLAAGGGGAPRLCILTTLFLFGPLLNVKHRIETPIEC